MMQTVARVLLDASLGIGIDGAPCHDFKDEALNEVVTDVLEERYEKALAVALEKMKIEANDTISLDGSKLNFLNAQSPRFVDWCMIAGVASLYLFLQANVTGGNGNGSAGEIEAKTEPVGGSSFQRYFNHDHEIRRSGLEENGEEVVGRLSCPGHLTFALSVLSNDTFKTHAAGIQWNWWYARALLVQQRCLSGKSEILRSKMTNAFYPVLRKVRSAAANDDNSKLVAASACLEGAMMEMAYDDTTAAIELIQSALLDHLGLEVSVGGALGTRTVHQQDPKSQLVLNFKRIFDRREAQQLYIESSVLDEILNPNSNSNFLSSNDILPHPHLISETESPSLLTPLEQAAVLALAAHKRKTSPKDAIQPWELSAYTDTVLQQDRSEFIVRAVAFLQVARFELSRSRTKERGLAALERLASALTHNLGSGVSQLKRMRGVFSVWFPVHVTLKKELGEAYVSLGMVGEAMHLFEQLELWDELIVCYRLLDQKVAAEQLIRKRLESTPNDPKLWCGLGDLTLDDEYYRRAWEVSGQKSARAQRSLARSAMRSGDYQTAQEHWEKAVSISPLFSGETWFSLGWCCIKTKNASRALTALTRAAQMNPEDGETWNNLAAVHMHLEHWREAFSSLTEAVKHNRDSWHTWDNYSTVAAKVDAWQAAINAVSRVVTLSHGKRINLEVLGALVERASTENQLTHPVGQLLKQIASTAAADSEFWVLYARYYYKCVGEKDAALECLMKRVRGLQGFQWKEEEGAFVGYATACIDLCKMYLEMNKTKELGSGRMLIRGALKSAEERFSDHDLYKDLQILLADIQEKVEK